MGGWTLCGGRESGGGCCGSGARSCWGRGGGGSSGSWGSWRREVGERGGRMVCMRKVECKMIQRMRDTRSQGLVCTQEVLVKSYQMEDLEEVAGTVCYAGRLHRSRRCRIP